MPNSYPTIYRTLSQYPCYQFRSDGSVWSCKKHHGSTGWHKLRPRMNLRDCLIVTLYVKGEKLTRKVHRLILGAFVGPCPEGMECCHWNGDATDNCIENLRWDTKKANRNDSCRHETVCCGERSPNAKLTAKDIREIRRLYMTKKYLQRDLAKQFGVTQTTISLVLRGKKWAHVF